MTVPSLSPVRTNGSRAVPAKIAAIATHVPDRILSNEELAGLFPTWPAEKILEKTGIRERRIAAPDETASDLAFAAARKLFASGAASPDEVDFLIFCTQASDYVLPTTACLLQSRLDLPRHIGAIDVNLGCSGFVYCLSLGAGLIASGAASRILILTADTYSKYIHELDKSVRTLFGDGAAATLLCAAGEDEGARVGPFIFGTDGAGARDLIVETGGFRRPRCPESAIEAEDASGNTRSADNLYMDGARVMSFTLKEIPKAYRELLAVSGITEQGYDHLVLHQANRFMLDALQKKMAVPDAKLPRHFENIGNTVSSTIPFVLANLMETGQMAPGTRIMLIGFGVGLSWAGASIIC
jgi:3-oxoacyl-[acyl-carrier-protein] synthase-3